MIRGRFKSIPAIILALGLLIISGCSAGVGNPEEDGTLTIVASFTPIYALTLVIVDGAENVSVSSMTSESTGCPHDYQLTPSDMQAVEKADLFIINGSGMEGSFIDKITAQYKDLPIIDSTEGLKNLIVEDHDHEGGASDGESFNPHTWLSIDNAVYQAEKIAAALAKADPDNSTLYYGNFDKFKTGMETLDQEYRDNLLNSPQKTFVTFHEAFEYLANDYSLSVAAVIEETPGTAPDPKTLQALIDKVESEKIKAIFTEPQYPDSTAKVIAADTGAKIYQLNPIVTGTMDKDSFLKIMTENLRTLKMALYS